MAELSWSIGLMSGTSMDGIDAALLRTDGRERIEAGPALTLPYDDGFRQRLRAILGGKGDVRGVERDLTLRHAEAVKALLAKAGLAPGQVGLVGFHGQTILHAPDRGKTWQIGDGALLAAETGIDVVCDFRSADVAAGGQGAPLVTVFHAALSAGLERPLAVLNIGGVSNVTWIGASGDLLAFDTGPGNAPIDDWALRHTGTAVDRDGALARSGKVDRAILDRLLAHPYFAQRPPKSLDRNSFDLSQVNSLGTADGAATLTAFTTGAVHRASTHFPAAPRRWIVCGGGRHNPAILQGLRDLLGVPVDPAEAVGWDGDALEAQAFAYLAVRSRLGLPLSLPGTTGVSRPQPGGVLFQAPRPAA
jgi:anhydro-N-acetylmuramic acid kinase